MLGRHSTRHDGSYSYICPSIARTEHELAEVSVVHLDGEHVAEHAPELVRADLLVVVRVEATERALHALELRTHLRPQRPQRALGTHDADAALPTAVLVARAESGVGLLLLRDELGIVGLYPRARRSTATEATCASAQQRVHSSHRELTSVTRVLGALPAVHPS